MTACKRITIRPHGRLANQMMQLMLALELRDRISPDVEIAGYSLPEWGLYPPPTDSLPQGGRVAVLEGQNFNLDKIAFALKIGLIDGVTLRGWGMRLEYYRDPRPFAEMFRANGAAFHAVGDDEILLNVRAEDIMSGFHKSYFPLPVAWYEHVVRTTGLRPVFMGQLEDSAYSRLIRSRFPEARYLPSDSPVSDFQTIRNARHVAPSISSFAWLAAWLSEAKQSVHMPVCGLFDPTNSGAMLLPIDDARYRFYRVPFPPMEARASLDQAEWLAAPHTVGNLTPAQVADICRPAL